MSGDRERDALHVDYQPEYRAIDEQYLPAFMPEYHSAAAKRRDCPLESQEQQALMSWARWMECKYPELRLLVHVPNGGLRNATEAARFKTEGVRRGFPDLMLPVARHGYHALAIELKRQHGGTVSPEQKAWLDALTEQGWRAVVCKGWLAARDEILAYLAEGAP